MAPKRAMLRECRRVARSGALMAFSVISLAAAPSDDEGRRLLQLSGPPYPDAGADYALLLRESGWDVIERLDVTAEFARCMGVLLDETRARRDALLALLGEQDFAERLQRRESTRASVERGLLKRESFVAGDRQLPSTPPGHACAPGPHQPSSHGGTGPKRATRKSISTRTRDG